MRPGSLRGPLRVAMIIQGYHPRVGGAERQLAALAPFLQGLGIHLEVFTRRYAGLEPFEQVSGVPVHRLPIPGPKPLASLVFTLTALPALRRFGPHVIHAHELMSPATTALAARRLLRVPVVVKVLRGGSLGDLARIRQKPFARCRIRALAREVDAFVAISREIEAELAGIGVPPARVAFIPNGVDPARFTPLPTAARPAARRALGIEGGPVAIFTGRLAPEKRVADLVQIWPAVRAAHPDARLLILGSGEEESHLRELMMGTSFGEGVRLLGQVEDVGPYLRTADLFVLPSVAEGLSNALLEAMAAGLPVVASAVGGAVDLIEPREDGWLIPPGDVDALREAVLAVFRNPEKARAMGSLARERVGREYSLPATARRLYQLYSRLAVVRISRGDT